MKRLLPEVYRLVFAALQSTPSLNGFKQPSFIAQYATSWQLQLGSSGQSYLPSSLIQLVSWQAGWRWLILDGLTHKSTNWQRQLKLTRPCVSMSNKLAQSSSNEGWFPNSTREGKPWCTGTFKRLLALWLLVLHWPRPVTWSSSGWRDEEINLLTRGVIKHYVYSFPDCYMNSKW